ncbi:MAG: hypothetical protein K5681_09825, partial [Treponema sp.]|nr:hypothetical protein [Treponema sp.]
MKKINLFATTILLALIALVSCKKDQEYKANSGKAPPSEKLKLTYNISTPSTSASRESPDSLEIYFDGSATKLEDIDKEPSGTITISPAIAGKWTWVSDRHLSFQPEENWKLDTKYKISMSPDIFADNVSVKGESSFTTPAFNVFIDSAYFAVDPLNPNIKRVYATLSATNPMQKELVEKFISLSLELKGSKNTVKSDIGFS